MSRRVGKSLCARLVRLDSELENAGADIGARGEPSAEVSHSNSQQVRKCPDCGYRMRELHCHVWHCARCYYAEPSENTPLRIARDLRAKRKKVLAFRVQLAREGKW